MSFTGNKYCRFCGDIIEPKDYGLTEDFGDICPYCFCEKVEHLMEDKGS